MLNDIPFTKNPDNWHCVHAAMHGVIKYFLKEHYSFDFINALMSPDNQMWVWPSQVVKVLHEAGLFVRFFSQRKLNVSSIKQFSYHAGLTSNEWFSESLEYVEENGLHEQKNLSIEELERLIYDGCVPMVILGHKKRLGKYVILTGFDAKHFYYHNSGPSRFEANKKITKEDFLKKWMIEPSNNSVIVVYGKQLGDDYTRFHF